MAESSTARHNECPIVAEADPMRRSTQWRAAAAVLSVLALTACVTERAGSVGATAPSENVMTRQKYERYVQLFNAGDPRYADYYEPDVVFDARPAPQPLRGRQAILDMYDDLRKQLTEEITIGAVVIDNEQGLMAVELTNRIVATQDNVKLPSRTLNKGDVSVGSGMIIYGLSNGRISYIREPKSGRSFTPATR
jgi:hypothetical protein